MGYEPRRISQRLILTNSIFEQLPSGSLTGAIAARSGFFLQSALRITQIKGPDSEYREPQEILKKAQGSRPTFCHDLLDDLVLLLQKSAGVALAAAFSSQHIPLFGQSIHLYTNLLYERPTVSGSRQSTNLCNRVMNKLVHFRTLDNQKRDSATRSRLESLQLPHDRAMRRHGRITSTESCYVIFVLCLTYI